MLTSLSLSLSPLFPCINLPCLFIFSDMALQEQSHNWLKAHQGGTAPLVPWSCPLHHSATPPASGIHPFRSMLDVREGGEAKNTQCFSPCSKWHLLHLPPFTAPSIRLCAGVFLLGAKQCLFTKVQSNAFSAVAVFYRISSAKKPIRDQHLRAWFLPK